MRKIKGLIFPDNDFNVILYQVDFNNLKVAIKTLITEQNDENLFTPCGNIEPEVILNALKNQDFGKLPKYMEKSAKDAFDALLKTNDAQLCDIIIDKAILEEMKIIAKCTKFDFVKKYVELFIVSCDIKSAVRGCMFNKSKNFFELAIVGCETLDKEKLVKSACENLESIYEYILTTDYAESVLYLKKSAVDFEKWFDDTIMECAKKQKSNSFTIEPLIAYILARKNEIKIAKIICLGKKYGINTDLIKERVRKMYV